MSSLVILARGDSSRMKKENLKQKKLSPEEIRKANERSKRLIAVGQNERPMLYYGLYNGKKAGYTKIYIVIGENGQMFRESYDADHNGNFMVYGYSLLPNICLRVQ